MPNATFLWHCFDGYSLVCTYEPTRTKGLIYISRNLLTIYRKYCNLIGYRTHYLSSDRYRLRDENK